MGRRKISNRELKWIAEGRMGILLDYSERAGLAGDMDRSRRYLQLARAIGMRTNIPMPSGFMFCKKCQDPLFPGRNCRVRLRSGKVIVHCLTCDTVRRRPYVGERGGKKHAEED
jgi:ribonuclease P protein subunit RPR2